MIPYCSPNGKLAMMRLILIAAVALMIGVSAQELAPDAQEELAALQLTAPKPPASEGAEIKSKTEQLVNAAKANAGLKISKKTEEVTKTTRNKINLEEACRTANSTATS
mgnify:CR=1 FL=1